METTEHTPRFPTFLGFRERKNHPQIFADFSDFRDETSR